MRSTLITTALRLRATTTASAAVGLILVQLAVGALYPAVGKSIGQLSLPSGVAQLLGGADFGTVTGWFRSEIAAIYGPLVVAGVTVVAAAALTAGDEESRVLSLLLAHPVSRRTVLVSRAVVVAVVAVVLAAATGVGMVAGVALAGGGIGVGHIVALALQLALFGIAIGFVALGVGAATGRRGAALGVAAAVGVLGWLINSVAPLVDGLRWLRVVSPFRWYAEGDPLTRGVDKGGALALIALAVVMLVLGIVAFERRDLRG